MKYINNRLSANIIKLEDENNNYTSENVEGALEEIDSKIKNIESQGYDDTKIRQDINNIKTEIGTEDLTTDAINIKGAINEIDSKIKNVEVNGYDDTQIKQNINNIKNEIGSATLNTTDKTVKGAINEIDSKIENKIDRGESGVITNDMLSQEVKNAIASGSSSSGNNNASDITITDTGNYFTSGNVEGALQEVGTKFSETVKKGESGVITNTMLSQEVKDAISTGSSTGGSNNASDITITDSGNYFTGENVEGALQEVGSKIKDMAKKTIIEGNKIYLAKNDGTKLDAGTILPTNGTVVNNIHVTPAMFGGVGDGVTDDNAAIQSCLNIEGCVVIDLMGKTWYSSKTLNLVNPTKTIQNGNIITDGNTFENKFAWVHSIRFINLDITSREGYVFYIRNIDDVMHSSEYYDILYLNVRLDGKLGCYYAHNNQIGFSQTFIDVHARSKLGNGFSGVKGPGTTMLHCVNEGIPNGALFYNCFCDVINSDSNNLMKHGIHFSDYFNGSLARFKNCNFEHCKEKGLNCEQDGLKIELDNCSFNKTYKTEERTNSECMYIHSPIKVKISDISISDFDYGEGYYDLVYRGSPYFEINNKQTLKVNNPSFYRLNSFVFPEVLDGQVKPNEVTREGTSPVIERYSENEINNYNSTNFMTMFYSTKTKDVTLDSESLLEFGKDTPLSNHFVINDESITEVKGVSGTFTDKLGNGSIVSIKNNTTHDVTLTNKHWTGKQFIFKDNADKILAANETIIFVLKDNAFYEWF